MTLEVYSILYTKLSILLYSTLNLLTSQHIAGTMNSLMPTFAPEILTHIGPIPITNTLINTLIVDALIIGTILILKNRLKSQPTFFQNLIEYFIEIYYNFVQSIAGKNTRKVFALVMTFFVFVLLANWSGLVPGIGTFGFFDMHEGKKEFVPLIRNATSDLNVTLALAVISLVATHVLALKNLGIKEYINHFFTFDPWYFIPIFIFVGFLEIVSEFTKIISLSFRLFGNIYAGEVVLTTISSIFAFLFPIPFFSIGNDSRTCAGNGFLYFNVSVYVYVFDLA